MNIDNGTWLIENGVLKEYRGTSKKVKIPEGVTEIGGFTFTNNDFDCLVFPSTIKTIRKNAFIGCYINYTKIPDNVETIEEQAFIGNEIKTLKLLSQKIKINSRSFLDNTIYTLITGNKVDYDFIYTPHNDTYDNSLFCEVQEIVINIGDKDEKIDLIDKLPKLIKRSLQSITIRGLIFNNRKSFFDYAERFHSCSIDESKIKFIIKGTIVKKDSEKQRSEVTFINAVYEAGDYYVGSYECYAEDFIDYLSDDTWLIENGVLLEYRGNNKNVEIPNGVIEISSEVFLNSHIKTVFISKTVKKICGYAFNSCNIEELIIPDSVVHIGIMSFHDNRINSVKFGENLRIIDWSAFRQNKLETVELPESLTELGGYAFSGNCLKSIIIPENLKTIPHNAFASNNISQVSLGNVEKIGEFAFYQNNITSLILPESLKEIGSRSFMKNQIKTLVIKYPIYIKEVFFQENPVETLYLNADANLEFLKSQYSTSGVAVYGIDDIFPELKEVYIENHHHNIIEYLTTLSHLKTITKIVISELSPIERLKLAKVFKTFKNRGVEIIIGAKIDFPEEEFETKVPDQVSLTYDSEINELHNKILNLTRLMSEKERKVIHDEVTSKIDKYKEDLLNYKAEYDLEESDKISLTLEPNDPKSLKERLIRYLDQVIMSLELKESHFKELENISRYQEMLKNPNLEEPLQIETDEDAIKYIIWVSYKYQNDEIKNRLKKILEDATTELSKDLVKKDFVLVNINPIQEFWKKVQTLKDIVEKYKERCDRANEKYTSITGGNESSLSEIVKETNAIINKLDEKNRYKFLGLMKDIRAKQADTIKRISEDLDGNNKSDKPENMELEFRQDLQELLTELNKIAKQSMDARTILNGLNNSLEILNGESTEANSVIEEEVIGILELLENESITDEQKTNTIKLLKIKLEKWIEILLTTNIDEIRVKGEFENDPFFKEWENMKPEKIVFTDSKQIVLVAILKELYGIKNKIEGYIEKNISYKEITKSLETRRQTK